MSHKLNFRSKSLALIFFLLLNLSGMCQLIVQNSTSQDISIAIGWHSNTATFEGFITKGWYNLKPGDKLNLGLTFVTGENNFYYYAKMKDGRKWEGNYKFLVKKTAFEIKNADKQFSKDQDTSCEWALFGKKTLNFGILETKTYTLNLVDNSEKETNAEFQPAGTFSWSSENFQSTIKLTANKKNDYKIAMEGASQSCMLQFEADGFYNIETKELIFTSEGCKLTFMYTDKSDLKLISVSGDACENFHGMSCDFYLVTYKKVK